MWDYNVLIKVLGEKIIILSEYPCDTFPFLIVGL